MDDPKAAIPWPKIKRILKFAVPLLLVILALVYGPQMWRTRSAEAAFQNYNRAKVAKNYAAAYELLTEETRNAGSIEGFIQVQQANIAKYGELRGFAEQTINAHLQDPKMVAIHASMIYDKGRVPFVVLLKRQTLFWVVYGDIEE